MKVQRGNIMTEGPSLRPKPLGDHVVIAEHSGSHPSARPDWLTGLCPVDSSLLVELKAIVMRMTNPESVTDFCNLLLMNMSVHTYVYNLYIWNS